MWLHGEAEAEATTLSEVHWPEPPAVSGSVSIVGWVLVCLGTRGGWWLVRASRSYQPTLPSNPYKEHEG